MDLKEKSVEIESSMPLTNTKIGTDARQDIIEQALKQVREETIEECEFIATKYEPSEKSKHVTYASQEIRELKGKS